MTDECYYCGGLIDDGPTVTLTDEDRSVGYGPIELYAHAECHRRAAGGAPVMTRHLRDTEDGINEAGWEAEMTAAETYRRKQNKQDFCDECRMPSYLVTELHIDNGENGSAWLCRWCYEKATETGSCDPENRDWDAERELREFEGDL